MIQYHFPTAVLSEHHIMLADKMLSVAKKYLADPAFVGRRWGYRNTFDSPTALDNMPDIIPFKELVNKTGRNYLKQLGYNDSSIVFETQIFVSEMFEGNYHEEHTHPNSILSGLLYLQVPEGSAPLIVLDPRPFRNFVMLPKLLDTIPNIEEISIKPSKGLLLMWESWIPHMVPQTHNKEGRITMVFNLSRKSA